MTHRENLEDEPKSSGLAWKAMRAPFGARGSRLRSCERLEPSVSDALRRIKIGAGPSLFRKQCAPRRGAWGASPLPSSSETEPRMVVGLVATQCVVLFGPWCSSHPVSAVRFERKRNCHAKKEKEEKEVKTMSTRTLLLTPWMSPHRVISWQRAVTWPSRQGRCSRSTKMPLPHRPSPSRCRRKAPDPRRRGEEAQGAFYRA